MGRQYPVVLVIDDSVAFREFTKYSIKNDLKFVNIFQASGGMEGLKMFKHYKPDVVLLDVNMPDLNGMIVLDAIVKNDSNTRVIMTTAYDDDQNIINQMIKRGAFSFVPKPMNRINLLKVVSDALRERRNAKFYGKITPIVTQR